MSRKGPAQPLVVHGTHLAQLLHPWASRLDKESKDSLAANGATNRMATILSSSQRISNHTGMEETGCVRYVRGKIKAVPLGLADQILQVPGLEHELGGDQLPIYQNPNLHPRTYRKKMIDAGADPDDYPPFPST